MVAVEGAVESLMVDGWGDVQTTRRRAGEMKGVETGGNK